jgi:hypothetical protein
LRAGARGQCYRQERLEAADLVHRRPAASQCLVSLSS